MSDDALAQTFPPGRGHRRLAVAGCLATLLGSLALSAAPVAAWTQPPPTATPPDVTTGPAQSVTYDSATLIGWIDPRGSATSYYFQYGPTAAYGAQTARVAVGAVRRAVRVAVAVRGLRPLTTYHFRLIAVNAAGTNAGAERVIETLRAPSPPSPPHRAPTPPIHSTPPPPVRVVAPARPAVTTGAATSVSYGSAAVIGWIAPRGTATSYYFQYGPTRAYGGQTPLAQVAALPVGHTVRVSAAVGGLAPLTIYHYRLVAVNAAGAATGADRTFKTGKVPLSLAILASPSPVLFGDVATIQGTLSGTGSGNFPVVLQDNPFPYTQGFVTIGNPELTSSTGGFSFPVGGLVAATQFRVVTDTKVPIVSPVVTEGVAVRVEAHVRHTRRRHHARIYGTVTPAVEGMEVAILRVRGGHEAQVARTFLRHGTATSSRFSRVIRVHKHAVYRVLVRVTNGAQTSNYSLPLFIR